MVDVELNQPANLGRDGIKLVLKTLWGERRWFCLRDDFVGKLGCIVFGCICIEDLWVFKIFLSG